ncbi:MAG: PAS domain-containing protein, partial [Defluviitaleaceae bacterium]|nr:PAS domain-containing protein [Defluviitaleaceae bacterium]
MNFNQIYRRYNRKSHQGNRFNVAAVMDSLPIACCAMDYCGNIVDCNKAFNSLFGFDNKNAAIYGFARLLPERQQCGGLTQGIIAENIKKALKQFSAQFELICNKTNGQPAYLEINLREENGFIISCWTAANRYNSGFYRAALDYAIEKEREALDYQRRIYDADPIPGTLWDKHYNLIDCNKAATITFQTSTKQDFIDNFYNFTPEYQPNGNLSSEKIKMQLKEAFKNGTARFLWLHQTLEGDPIPMEVIFVRIALKNGDRIVAGYAQDLRPFQEANQRALEAERKAEQKTEELTRLMLDSTPMAV